MVARPVTLYGVETVALRRRQEAEREVGEMMLRFIFGTNDNYEEE